MHVYGFVICFTSIKQCLLDLGREVNGKGEGPPMNIRFWGVRGGIATPGDAFRRYGGNTSCVEVSVGETRIMLDAGTGACGLGQQIARQQQKNLLVLLSHLHSDHIAGFRFFAPAFVPETTVTVMSGNLKPPHTTRSVFEREFSSPVHPIPLDEKIVNTTFEDFVSGDALDVISGIDIKTLPLNHQDGATAYRLSANGKSVCYVTDVEHEVGRLSADICAFVEGADLMIYDSTYTDEEFDRYIDWGHSTWQEAVRIGNAGNVGRVALFHHSHLRTDDEMDRIVEQASNNCSLAFAARDGLQLEL